MYPENTGASDRIFYYKSSILKRMVQWFHSTLCFVLPTKSIRYRLQKQYPKNHITDQGPPHEPKLVKLTHSCLSKTSAFSAFQLREAGRFVDTESIRELNMLALQRDQRVIIMNLSMDWNPSIFNSYLLRVSSQRWTNVQLSNVTARNTWNLSGTITAPWNELWGNLVGWNWCCVTIPDHTIPRL